MIWNREVHRPTRFNLATAAVCSITLLGENGIAACVIYAQSIDMHRALVGGKNNT